MRKIPTMFERDWLGDKSRVIDKIVPGCEWVTAGEGIATRKIDGTSCMVRAGQLFKRRELRNGEPAPDGFEPSDREQHTNTIIGWVLVGQGPEDRWHREAILVDQPLAAGTYELVGPKIQGNRERYEFHRLVSHNATDRLPEAPRTFEGLKTWLADKDIEASSSITLMGEWRRSNCAISD